MHSLDAAHLVRVVNTALGQLIQDIITTHDCYYCLAPHALVFNRIIRWEMGDMYRQFDPLADLRNRNVDHDIFPRRPHGELDPLAVNFSETAFS